MKVRARKKRNVVKRDLVKKVSGQTGIDAGVVKIVVENFLDYVKYFVMGGARIEIRGFGVFWRRTIQYKDTHRVGSEEKVKGKKWRKVYFKPSKFMKEELPCESKSSETKG